MAKNLIDDETFEFVEGTEKTDYEAVAGDVSNLKTRMTAAENEIDSAESDISALQARMSTAEDDIDTVEGNVTDLQTRMTTAEDDIDAAEGNISDLQSRMTTAESDIDTAEGNISSLGTRMNNAERSISSLDTTVTAVKKGLAINSTLANYSGTATKNASNTIPFAKAITADRILQVRITAGALKYSPSYSGDDFADISLVFENGETSRLFKLTGTMAAQGSETNTKVTDVTIQVYLYSGEYVAWGQRVRVSSGGTAVTEEFSDSGTLTLGGSAITGPAQLGALTAVKLKWDFSGSYWGYISAQVAGWGQNA